MVYERTKIVQYSGIDIKVTIEINCVRNMNEINTFDQ